MSSGVMSEPMPSARGAARPCSTSDRSGCAPWPALRQTARTWAEREQRFIRAGDGGEKLPAGKDADAAGGAPSAAISLILSPSTRWRLRRPCTAASKALGHRRLGQRQQLRFIQPDCERCVSGSNLRMVSISSPKNSMRTGRSASGEYTSRIPPRRVNWPGISTRSICV
jgi:hypothetical protein